MEAPDQGAADCRRLAGRTVRPAGWGGLAGFDAAAPDAFGEPCRDQIPQCRGAFRYCPAVAVREFSARQPGVEKRRGDLRRFCRDSRLVARIRAAAGRQPVAVQRVCGDAELAAPARRADRRPPVEAGRSRYLRFCVSGGQCQLEYLYVCRYDRRYDGDRSFYDFRYPGARIAARRRAHTVRKPSRPGGGGARFTAFAATGAPQPTL